MRTKTTLTVLLLLALSLSLLPMQRAAADTGPKPTMSFDFTQSSAGPKLDVTDGTLLECQQADCSDGQELKQLGPQHFSCSAAACDSLAYGYSPYHKLMIKFSDGKTRANNIFQTAGFDSKYKVTIRPDDLQVEATLNLDVFSPWTYVILCACLLALLLVVVAAIVLFVRRRRQPQ